MFSNPNGAGADLGAIGEEKGLQPVGSEQQLSSPDPMRTRVLGEQLP